MELSEMRKKIAYLDGSQARALLYAMIELEVGKKAFEVCYKG